MIEIQKIGHQAFIHLLNLEYSKRVRKNPQYSLRAFATYLEIDPGHLSRLLSQKRSPSLRVKENVLQKLNIDPSQLLELSSFSEAAESKLLTMNIQHFQVISEWQHFAILELTYLDNFQSNEKWIADKLSLPVIIIKASIQRLKDLGYLKLEKGRLIDVSGNMTTVGHNFTSQAQKKLQSQILEQSKQALDNVNYELRSHSALTFACGDDEIEEIKEMIRGWENQLVQYLESKNNKKRHVYQMQYSFFPITKQGNPK